jgi:hypothetical protein
MERDSMRLRGRSTEYFTAAIYGIGVPIGIAIVVLNPGSVELVALGVVVALGTGLLAVRSWRAGIYVDDAGITTRMDVSTRRWRWDQIALVEYSDSLVNSGVYMTATDGVRRKILHLNRLGDQRLGPGIVDALTRRLGPRTEVALPDIQLRGFERLRARVRRLVAAHPILGPLLVAAVVALPITLTSAITGGGGSALVAFVVWTTLWFFAYRAMLRWTRKPPPTVDSAPTP